MVGGDGGASTVTLDGEPGRVSLRKQHSNQDLKDQERSPVLGLEKGFQAARTAHRKALRWGPVRCPYSLCETGGPPANPQLRSSSSGVVIRVHFPGLAALEILAAPRMSFLQFICCNWHR